MRMWIESLISCVTGYFMKFAFDLGKITCLINLIVSIVMLLHRKNISFVSSEFYKIFNVIMFCLFLIART